MLLALVTSNVEIPDDLTGRFTKADFAAPVEVALDTDHLDSPDADRVYWSGLARKRAEQALAGVSPALAQAFRDQDEEAPSVQVVLATGLHAGDDGQCFVHLAAFAA